MNKFRKAINYGCSDLIQLTFGLDKLVCYCKYNKDLQGQLTEICFKIMYQKLLI